MAIEIPLSRGLVALVDDADAEQVLALGKWYADRSNLTFYARKNFQLAGRWVGVRMHRLLTPDWPLTDHINGDGLDNRRSNLREATPAQNAQNRGMRSDNTCGFKGVYWHTQREAWVASIYLGGSRHLGLFDSAESAAMAYDAAALHHFGQYARLNFPQGATA